MRLVSRRVQVESVHALVRWFMYTHADRGLRAVHNRTHSQPSLHLASTLLPLEAIK